MATITITIPDAKLAQALDAIAWQTGWEEEPDPADPEWDPDKTYLTKAQHVKAWLLGQVKAMVRRDRLNEEHDVGVATVDAEMATW